MLKKKNLFLRDRFGRITQNKGKNERLSGSGLNIYWDIVHVIWITNPVHGSLTRKNALKESNLILTLFKARLAFAYLIRTRWQFQPNKQTYSQKNLLLQRFCAGRRERESERERERERFWYWRWVNVSEERKLVLNVQEMSLELQANIVVLEEE